MGHMCQMDKVLFPREKLSQCLHALFLDSAKQIKTNCNCEVKPQWHNVAYNLKKNLWAISTLSSEKIQYDVCRGHVEFMFIHIFIYCNCHMHVKHVAKVYIFLQWLN